VRPAFEHQDIGGKKKADAKKYPESQAEYVTIHPNHFLEEGFFVDQLFAWIDGHFG